MSDFEERMKIHCGLQLDAIGTAYGITRDFAESDDTYRARIAAEATKPRQAEEPPPKTAQQLMDARIAESAIDRIDRMFKKGRTL